MHLVWLDSLGRDMRSARRALQQSRGFSTGVIASLATGMAVTIAALALLNASMVLPFPAVAEQSRLVRLSVSRNCGRPDCWIRMSSPADFELLRGGLNGLQGIAAYTAGEIPVAVPHARSMRSVLTSVEYFDVLGVRLALGRTFARADDERDAAVALISHNVWVREFNADPSAVGQSIRAGDQFVEIVGVAPPAFIGVDRIRPGGRAPEIWLPLWLADRVLPLTREERRKQERDLAFVGRLRDGFGVPELQAEAQVMSHRLAAARGSSSPGGLAEVRRVWRVDPRSWHFGVIIVMPVPILVLAIACVNAANLMLARGSQRQREIAIRLAIGAGRHRVIRQLLFESAMLAAIATAVAIPVAWWAMRLASSPLNEPIPIDTNVLTLTVLAGVVTTLTFGLVPALRVSAQRPSSALGPGGPRSDAVPRQSRLRRVLVVAQVALSLGLLATAGQLVTTVRAQAVSGGTSGDRLLIARFDLQPLNLAAGQAEAFYADLLAGVSRLPGVEAAGLARQTSVWTFGQRSPVSSLAVWRPADKPEEGRIVQGGYAAGDLFEAVGSRIVAGRSFTEADRHARPQVAVVNQSAAVNLDAPIVGSTLRVAPRGDFASAIEVRIVGIIEPTREPRLERDAAPAAKVYLPSPLEAEPALTLYARTAGPATAIAQPVRDLVSRIAPRVPVQEIGSLEELNERSYATQLWLARAAAVLGVTGLLLATAGLYGVSSYVVAMRAREIAIRMAIGAAPRAILSMILTQSMRIAAIGLVTGGAAAIAVSRIIQSEYHGIVDIDAAALAGAAALFVAAMLLASAVPAVRASRIDPVENLKHG